MNYTPAILSALLLYLGSPAGVLCERAVVLVEHEKSSTSRKVSPMVAYDFDSNVRRHQASYQNVTTAPTISSPGVVTETRTYATTISQPPGTIWTTQVDLITCFATATVTSTSSIVTETVSLTLTSISIHTTTVFEGMEKLWPRVPTNTQTINTETLSDPPRMSTVLTTLTTTLPGPITTATTILTLCDTTITFTVTVLFTTGPIQKTTVTALIVQDQTTTVSEKIPQPASIKTSSQKEPSSTPTVTSSTPKATSVSGDGSAPNPIQPIGDSPGAQSTGSVVAVPTAVLPNGASLIPTPPDAAVGTFTTTIGSNLITVAPVPSGQGVVINGMTISAGSTASLNGMTFGYETSSLWVLAASGQPETYITTIGNMPVTIASLGAIINSIINGGNIVPGETTINGIALSYGQSGFKTVSSSNGGVFEAITLASETVVLIGGQTLTSGGVVVVSGTTYQLPTGGTIPIASAFTAVANGYTFSPGETAVISGTTYVLPLGATSPVAIGSPVIIGGQTLTPGGTIIVSGTTYTLPTGATAPVVVPSSTGGPTSGFSRTSIGGLPQVTGNSNKRAVSWETKILATMVGIVQFYLFST